MRQYYFIVLLGAILACHSQRDNKNTTEVDKNNTSLEDLQQSDSIKKADSLKWFFYSLNYLDSAIFYDPAKKIKIKFSTIQCDINLMDFFEESPDSVYYYFGFNKRGLQYLYVDFPNATGLLVFGNFIKPFHHHLNFTDKPDSILQQEFQLYSKNFEVFLRNYKGEISPWLKQEAKRRKII